MAQRDELIELDQINHNIKKSKNPTSDEWNERYSTDPVSTEKLLMDIRLFILFVTKGKNIELLTEKEKILIFLNIGFYSMVTRALI